MNWLKMLDSQSEIKQKIKFNYRLFMNNTKQNKNIQNDWKLRDENIYTRQIITKKFEERKQEMWCK